MSTWDHNETEAWYLSMFLAQRTLFLSRSVFWLLGSFKEPEEHTDDCPSVRMISVVLLWWGDLFGCLYWDRRYIRRRFIKPDVQIMSLCLEENWRRHKTGTLTSVWLKSLCVCVLCPQKWVKSDATSIWINQVMSSFVKTACKWSKECTLCETHLQWKSLLKV